MILGPFNLETYPYKVRDLGSINSCFSVAYNPPEGKDYKWYILPIGGLVAIYHLLGEPETTIESRSSILWAGLSVYD